MFMKNNNEGSSLVGILIAVAIVGIIAKSMASYFSNQYQAVKMYSAQSDKEELRRWVKIGTDCSTAMTTLKNQCDGSSYVAVPSHVNNADLIMVPKGNSFTQVGNYYIRSTCTTTTNKKLITFNFSICKTTDGCKLKPEDWKSLFVNNIPFECSSN